MVLCLEYFPSVIMNIRNAETRPAPAPYCPLLKKIVGGLPPSFFKRGVPPIAPVTSFFKCGILKKLIPFLAEQEDSTTQGKRSKDRYCIEPEPGCLGCRYDCDRGG